MYTSEILTYEHGCSAWRRYNQGSVYSHNLVGARVITLHINDKNQKIGIPIFSKTGNSKFFSSHFYNCYLGIGSLRLDPVSENRKKKVRDIIDNI